MYPDLRIPQYFPILTITYECWLHNNVMVHVMVINWLSWGILEAENTFRKQQQTLTQVYYLLDPSQHIQSWAQPLRLEQIKQKASLQLTNIVHKKDITLPYFRLRVWREREPSEKIAWTSALIKSPSHKYFLIICSSSVDLLRFKK